MMWNTMALLCAWCAALGGAPAQLPPLASVSDGACSIFRLTQATGLVFIGVRGHDVEIETFGETAPGSGHKPDKRSLLRLCSITKVFTADVLTQLYETQRLQLRDPLQKFAPTGGHVPVKAVRGRASSPITLLDLATHTSGLPREIGAMPKGTPHFTYPSFELRWAWLKRTRLLTEPGTAALYSNAGFDFLADALSAATGEPYPQLLLQRILKPLGMKDTTFEPTQDDCLRLLRGGQDDEGPCTSTVNTDGSSGLYSTPEDVSRWLRYLVGDATVGARVNPAELDVYLAPAQLRSVNGLNHAGKPTGIGLAWIHLGKRNDASEILEKTGSGAGFHTYVAVTPAEHTAIFFAFTDGGAQTKWQDPFRPANDMLLALSNLPPLPPEPKMVPNAVKRKRRSSA